MALRILIATGLLVQATPALAQVGTSIPEPSDMLLLGMGVLGLILGRRGGHSRKPPRQ